jgi:hypothetical protein
MCGYTDGLFQGRLRSIELDFLLVFRAILRNVPLDDVGNISDPARHSPFPAHPSVRPTSDFVGIFVAHVVFY